MGCARGRDHRQHVLIVEGRIQQANHSGASFLDAWRTEYDPNQPDAEAEA
jgi:hypothetical protein